MGLDIGGKFENIFCAEQSTFAFDGLSACSVALQSNEIYLIFRSGYIDLTRQEFDRSFDDFQSCANA